MVSARSYRQRSYAAGPTLGEQALVNKTGNDVRVLEIVVVVRAEDVGGNGGGEVATVFLVVGTTNRLNQSSRLRLGSLNWHSLVVDVDEALAVGVTKVGLVRRPQVNVGFIDRVRDLVGEYASRQARDEFGHLMMRDE